MLRKICWFLIGIALFLSLSAMARSQDFENLPAELTGKLTASNTAVLPFDAHYIVLVATDLDKDPVYYLTFHAESSRNLSAGIVVFYGNSRNWIFKDGVWTEVDPNKAADWLRVNDKPEMGI